MLSFVTTEGLIDTTEMYLKAMLELEEDGIVPLRARIVERLGHRAPTVSQTIARLERSGLLHVCEDGCIELSETGREQAVTVMRKHRLVEVLLFNVIKLDWQQIHVEACRWEHVISERVERRVFEICGQPRFCPHGNPIPGLCGLEVVGEQPSIAPQCAYVLSDAVSAGHTSAVINRISDRVQDDVPFLQALHAAGMMPGTRVTIGLSTGNVVEMQAASRKLVLNGRQAASLMVSEVAVTGSVGEG